MKDKQKKRSGSKSIVPSPESRAFVDIIEHFSYQMGPNPQSRGLTNITFFVGAGFSKSWDPKAPVGSELFTIESKVVEKVANTLVLERMFGLDVFENITPDQLRQINYHIDMYERYPEVRSRYVDDQNLRMFRGALRAAIVDRYEKITDLNYFDSERQKFPLNNHTKRQKDIVTFFRYILNRIDGSQPLVEGVRTHFITTNYDYVIETILDNALDDEDSMFLYTYRGFTPDRVVNEEYIAPIHDHWLARYLLKINGGFEILRNGDNYILDYSKRQIFEVLRNPPVLMLASREQDYSDPYFKSIFPKAIRLLRDTTVVVLIGYSLPEDDALIRFILRQFSEEAEDGRDRAIFYIGPGDDGTKRTVLEKVFPSIQDTGVPRVITYNGGFDEFVAECLQLIVKEE